MQLRVLAFLAFSACHWPRAHAADSVDACTSFVTSLPAIITTPGKWCLQGNLSSAASDIRAIEIQADDVTIDCNGHRLSGTAGGVATNVSGVMAENRRNITVRHCDIHGYIAGISLSGDQGGGHTVEDNRLVGNTYEGITVTAGDGSVVRRNRVLATGGTTNVGPSSAIGIFAMGTMDVSDNIVAGVRAADPAGYAYGLDVMTNRGGSITGNRIRDIEGGTGDRAAIILGYDNDRVILRGNKLSAGSLPIGIECINGNDRARDNMVNGFSSPIVGCGDAGGNDVAY